MGPVSNNNARPLVNIAMSLSDHKEASTENRFGQIGLTQPAGSSASMSVPYEVKHPPQALAASPHTDQPTPFSSCSSGQSGPTLCTLFTDASSSLQPLSFRRHRGDDTGRALNHGTIHHRRRQRTNSERTADGGSSNDAADSGEISKSHRGDGTTTIRSARDDCEARELSEKMHETR